MSSKKDHGESRKKFDDSGRRNNDKKSTKEAYNKKNHKSSPTLSYSTSIEPAGFHDKASSKPPDDSDLNSSRNDNKKPTKGENFTSAQSDNQHQNIQSLSAQKRNAASFLNKNDKRNQPSNTAPSHFPSCQSEAKTSFKQAHSEKFQHDNQQSSFNQTGTKPKHHDMKAPVNQNVKHIQNRLPSNQENIKFQGPRQVNQNLKYVQNRLPSNQENSKQAEFQKNVKFQGPRQKQCNQHDRNQYCQNPMKTTPSGIQQNSSLNFPTQNRQVKCDTPTKNPNIHFMKQNSVPFVKPKKKRTGTLNPRKVQKHEKKDRKKANDVKKKMIHLDNSNATPLLSFQSANAEPEKTVDLMNLNDDEEEEDDNSSVFSQQSTDVDNLINFSDDESTALSQPSVYFDDLIDISLSQLSLANTATQIFSDNESDSDSTDESDLTSEFSVDSSILGNETRINILQPNMTLKESFVSVFWDIENCSLPQKKSAVDFASYVRDTFYEGRTEVMFTAACDVSNLKSTFLMRDLDEANITLIHISSLNKNAADKKIMSLLQKFQIQYRKSNSAVVLISSDSDFSQTLLDMRYQHHIFINLICNSSTRDSLTRAANKYVLFDDVLKDLPDRDAKNNMQHVIAVTNLPQIQIKLIKNGLSEKLKNFNCKLKFIDASMAKIFFKDHSVCLKALNSLKGFYLGGNALVFNYQNEIVSGEEKKKNVSSEEKKKNVSSKKKNVETLDINIENINVSKNIAATSEVSEESNSGKGATLCVVVSMCLKDTEYWKIIFEDIWKMADFSIHWDDSTFGGCFLIKFKSLKKAQKAKKILQKNQMNDANAPKFLKLIKHEDDVDNFKTDINSDIQETNKKRICEHLQIIEMKKLKFLKKHENVMNEIKCQAKSGINGATEAVNEKLKECIEQMETFKTFSSRTTNAVKNLSYISENLEELLKELLCDFTRECNCFTSALPIYAKKEDILKKIRENQVTVICGETGSGKSTQLTQYTWRKKNNFITGKVICTQTKKISTIFLAKHVSSQIGSRLGDTVGYQAGMSKKMSANTDILYVTDFTMLKMLVSEDMDSVSCIIIDEVNERTIYTDILLGMIKQYLPMHPQLRVVITSASNDVSIFHNFFALTDDAVLQIPRRTFPIEDLWLDCDVTPDYGYFMKAIDKTFEILSEDHGDILTFLMTPLETEKACKIFSKKLKGDEAEVNVRVFYVHSKMDSEELQKVFEKTPKGKRKVVFATSYAQTSVTIPGIKYVVDCGLIRDSKYEAVRNMNILSVGFISKTSADQRRVKAGWTEVGKCYHLYSQRNYRDMSSNRVPEILRINLGQAFLKLFEIGVEDPLQFHFIQSPSKEILKLVMNQLLFLNAVDENFTLTELGKNMAALPLEPRLCHLIFQGFGNNIGYDALVTAALVTMSRTIFFCNYENKDESNEKKKRFCEHGSDFISYLEVYKEWVDVPKHFKSQWCVNNCINAHSMRIVHELVNEIILILQKQLNLKVKLKFSSEDTTNDILTKIIFYSFSQNLSIFSGLPKYGYKSLNVPDQLFIHPSSSLSAFEQSAPPQYVVYDTILKTTRTFIVNVSPVPEEMIKDAVKLYGLKIDFEALEYLTGKEFCISPVGETIIFKYFVGKKGIKQKELQMKIKELTKSDFIDIHVDVSKRCIKIFDLNRNVDKIQSLVSPIKHDGQQFLLNEKRDVYLSENSQFTAILAAGGLINDVVLPGEFRDLDVILKSKESIESVCDKLSSCGAITDIHEKKNKYRVIFNASDSARKAYETYGKQTGFLLKHTDEYSPAHQRNYFFKVSATFFRRPSLGVAYVSVEPKISNLSFSDITYENKSVRVAICKKTQDIRITDLPVITNTQKLEKVISKILPSDVKMTKCIIPRKKPYESTKEEMSLVRRNLLEIFAQFTLEENFPVGCLKKPPPKSIIWEAAVYFKNSLDGENAANVLRYRKDVDNFVGGFTLKSDLNTFLYCKTKIFLVMREEIEESLEFFRKNQSVGSMLNIDFINTKNPDILKIRIISNKVCDVFDATRCIRQIISGNELRFPNDSKKAKLFSNYGKEMLKKLSLEFQDCYVLSNEYSKTVSIFGKKTSCNIIKMRINEFLQDTKNDDFKELSLSTSSGKSRLLKEITRKYGYDLQKLKDDCGVSDTEINKYSQLVIRGNPVSIVKCESLIQDMKDKLDANSADVRGEANGDICPVCCDDLSEDKYYLQYCGHAYCVECILHLFHSSTDIPLKCEFCQEPVVVADIFWAIKKRKALEEILFKKFLHYFVNSRSDISFCPSPECTMIFRVTDEINSFSCPSCGNSICTRCKNFCHFGISCSLNEFLNSNSCSLEIWKEEDPVNHKLCPTCSSPIERNGSDNHVVCWKCNCHMCWLCLKVFPIGNEAYLHLSKCPMNHPLMN